MAFDKLESMWKIPFILKSIKFNSDILHFFGIGFHSEIGYRESVYSQETVHQLWQVKVVLECLLQVLDVAMFHQQNDCIMLLEDTNYPPVESTALD